MAMISPETDLLIWLLFSFVLVWALWQGLPELVAWLARTCDGCEDIQHFPDELRGEPGPGTFAASPGETDLRDRHGRRQASDAGDGRAAAAQGPHQGSCP